MRYHNITKDDMVNGDGLRVVLWVSGCSHACPGCQNPVTWDINDGLEFDAAAKQELWDELEKDYVAGITFSGGDPLHMQNREAVGELITQIHSEFPQKTIWLYTGYCWEEICRLPFMQYIDVLVDGRFIQAQQDNRLMWRGSANQRVIDVKETLRTGALSLRCRD